MSEFVFKVCGIALISAMLALLLRKMGGEVATLLKISAGIVLASVCFGAAAPLMEYFTELAESTGDSGIYEAVELMLRVLATAIVTNVCANICRDCGEMTIGGYVELGGRVEIVLLTLPMIRKVVDLAVGML